MLGVTELFIDSANTQVLNITFTVISMTTPPPPTHPPDLDLGDARTELYRSSMNCPLRYCTAGRRVGAEPRVRPPLHRPYPPEPLAAAAGRAQGGVRGGGDLVMASSWWS